jgi:hypothetical protein
MKKVYVFGNPDLVMDSLPLKILSELEKQLPQIEFVAQDPNEESDFPENLIVLDTAIGIDEITVFDSLEKFAKVPRVSMHDFDALTNLRYLQKLGKIKTVKIIGVPATLDKKITLAVLTASVAAILSQLSR